MTDSSTSPVPPKEIEEAISELCRAMYGYKERACDLAGVSIYDSVEKSGDVDDRVIAARAALEALIASCTLSREEARTVMDGYHLDPSKGDDFPVLWAKLRRIAASTEEASQ